MRYLCDFFNQDMKGQLKIFVKKNQKNLLY
jgi:hypothetical protein